ncbi:DUF1127 domain-containing protein [Pseudomonas sp. PDM14]|uniref:DUF1127 domain-containing protein n=1 Tax=Pseudomonas sp. PDM14 TaxID=2769288 RepID=UPI00177F71C3|nr:DUF1127 domain-containing protein [Pseudomonas sp. PDM14]MBD9483117.1 DUF1127 domain-containing protein [Pseudomonas sp. PDM14]
MRGFSESYSSGRVRSQQKPVLRAADIAGRWRVLLRRLHTRRALLQLDADQLRDIGLTAEQAREEAQRPFWQLLR